METSQQEKLIKTKNTYVPNTKLTKDLFKGGFVACAAFSGSLLIGSLICIADSQNINMQNVLGIILAFCAAVIVSCMAAKFNDIYKQVGDFKQSAKIMFEECKQLISKERKI